MAKQKFERTKPHVNVGTIGHIDHGKTTLTAAITRCSRSRARTPRSRASTTSTRPRKSGSAGSRSTRRTSSTNGEPSLRARRLPRARRLHQEHDHGRRADGRRDPRGLGRRRPMPQTREHILLARQVEVPAIVVALNKADMVDDPELLELVEMEVREELKYEFPGDEIPVIKVSALKALEGDPEWTPKILELMEAVDSYIPEPTRDIDEAVPDADRGRLHDHEAAAPSSPAASSRARSRLAKRSRSSASTRRRQKTVVTGVEMFNKTLDYAQAGDNAGALLPQGRSARRSSATRCCASRARSRRTRTSTPGLHPRRRRVAAMRRSSTATGRSSTSTTDVTGSIKLPEEPGDGHAGRQHEHGDRDDPADHRAMDPVSALRDPRGGRTVGWAS